LHGQVAAITTTAKAARERILSTSNKQLADKARAIARKSDGQRIPANCVMIALTYSTSVKAAREALWELERPDVRRAALELLDELTSREAMSSALDI